MKAKTPKQVLKKHEFSSHCKLIRNVNLKLTNNNHKRWPQGRKKPRSDCPGQVNFALGQVKMEVWWPGGQVKLASAVLLVIIPVKNNLKT